MKLIIEGTAELPQVFLLFLFTILTIGIIICGIGLFLSVLHIPLLLILSLIICDVSVGIVYAHTRKKLKWLVNEREKNMKNISNLPSNRKNLSIGMIYLLRLGAIPILIGVGGLLYFLDFHKNTHRLAPLIIGFLIFVVYSIVIVKYLEKKER